MDYAESANKRAISASAEVKRPCEERDFAGKRDRAIQSTVVFATVSKLGSLFLRLVSIPIAINLLGLEFFGAYTVIVMAVWLIDVLHIGIGPALTQQISRAVASENRELETKSFSTAFLLSAALTLFAGLVAALVFYFIPISQLFGEKFAPMAATMERAIAIALVILLIEAICAIAEMARDGYQETRINYAWGAGGNVVAALLLLGGIWFFPCIEYLLIAVNGPIALVKLGNLMHLFRDRPWLVPRFSAFCSKLTRPLCLDGAKYSVTYILSALIEYNLFAFLIGHVVGPEAVGVFNVLVTIHFSLTSIVMMYSGPLWPAMLDASERGDGGWIHSRARIGVLLTCGFSLLCGIGLVVAGPWVLSLWLGKEFSMGVEAGFSVTRTVLVFFSAYLFLHLWRHVHQVLALGMGQVPAVCRILLLESALLIVAGLVTLYQGGGLVTLYAAFAGSILVVSAWALPGLFYRNIPAAEMPRPILSNQT